MVSEDIAGLISTIKDTQPSVDSSWCPLASPSKGPCLSPQAFYSPSVLGVAFRTLTSFSGWDCHRRVSMTGKARLSCWTRVSSVLATCQTLPMSKGNPLQQWADCEFISLGEKATPVSRSNPLLQWADYEFISLAEKATPVSRRSSPDQISLTLTFDKWWMRYFSGNKGVYFSANYGTGAVLKGSAYFSLLLFIRGRAVLLGPSHRLRKLCRGSLSPVTQDNIKDWTSPKQSLGHHI